MDYYSNKNEIIDRKNVRVNILKDSKNKIDKIDYYDNILLRTILF